VFAEAAAQDVRTVHAMARKWVAVMLGLGVAVALAGWLLAEPGVRLLFERGAFGPASTAAVAGTLRFAVLQVPFYFAGLVLVSVLSTLRLYGQIAVGAAFNLAIKLVVGWWLVRHAGLPGLVLSTALMYALSAAWLALAVRRAAAKAGG
jgi:peptidoglycan biosynthesis protein MviN/MurJ (putative lipid II flippase)